MEIFEIRQLQYIRIKKKDIDYFKPHVAKPEGIYKIFMTTFGSQEIFKNKRYSNSV